VTGSKLPREFYARDTRVVARELIGKVLVHRHGGRLRRARIVETEAYHGPLDKASHARFGRTARAAVMFGPPGFAYVYLVYGTSHCMNVVTGPEGFPAAVLVRAAEPLDGCLHSTRGPGNLCRALGIRRDRDNGRNLGGDELYLLDAPRPGRIVSSHRVNVPYAGSWAARPWRYALAGSSWVSRPPLDGFGASGSSRSAVNPARRRAAGSKAAGSKAAAAAAAGTAAGRTRRGGSAP
jgi:DNA-3-methyladenine glycosylase